MGILVLVNNFGIFQLYVEVLIDRMQRPPDCEIVLQFHGHLLPHQLLEVGEEQLHHKIKSNEKRFKTSIPNKIEKLDRRDTLERYHLFYTSANGARRTAATTTTAAAAAL